MIDAGIIGWRRDADSRHIGAMPGTPPIVPRSDGSPAAAVVSAPLPALEAGTGRTPGGGGAGGAA